MSNQPPKQSPKESTDHLPEFVLLSLARNQSADPAYRRAAVEHLIEKGFKEANHPDLELLVMQVMKERAAKEEVQAIVEAATESPFGLAPDSPKLSTGVTTNTLYLDEVINN